MQLIRKILLIALSILLFSAHLSAKNLKGTIKNIKGEPIPYATIYVKELAQGTTTNINGEFNLDLPAATYNINFRSLGFNPQTQTITVSNKVTELNIVLQEQVQMIQEVKVTSSGEDPAYAIIRKVIALSYIHLNQLNSYNADVYVRGTVKFESIPAIIRNQLKKRNIDVKTGDVLVNEVMSRINFKAPDRYEQRILSINSTFPDEVDFRMDDFLGSSLYQDNIDIYFSPLGRSAFSYYNFIYEGFDYDGDYTVNKIRVKPKRNGKQFFSGYLYIIENLWCLHRVDLSFDTPFGKVNVKQVFDEVRPMVWLPVGHNYAFKGGMVGLKADAKFGASIKYNNLELNKQVLAMANYPAAKEIEKKSEAAQTAKPVSATAAKRKQKIDELLEKDKLSNVEMNKLSRLMAKRDSESKPDTLRSLEIEDNLLIQKDANARKRDTTYWQEIRPIPLSDEELKSFQKRDSLMLSRQKIRAIDSTAAKVHKRDFGFFNPLLFGRRTRLSDSTWQMNYSGILNSNNINFNAVDGLYINQQIEYIKTFKPGHSLLLSPRVGYAFSRKTINADANIFYRYAPLRRGALQLSGGRYTNDFKLEPQAINPFINSVASLFFKENYARYYESRNINIENKIDVTNGLAFKASFGWNDIRELENSTNFSFAHAKDNYQKNIPLNPEIEIINLKNQISSVVDLRLEYTPKYFYKIEQGVKRMVSSKFPTIYINYRRGIPKLFGADSDFEFIGTGLLYSYKFYTSSTLSAELHAGWFTNNKQIHFSEFAHAPTLASPVNLKDYRNTFYNADYYELSTADQYARAHISYKAPFIALKYLPLLSNTLWREMVWAGYYTSPSNKNHIEVGYTLLEVLLSANIGVYAGWTDGEFGGFGFNLNFIFGNQ